jgi:MarR family transcriptional regulator, organic hydroperoxide resistance regulator
MSRLETPALRKRKTMSDEPYADQLPYLLAQANRNVHGDLQSLLKSKGVPVEQWRVLQVLSDGRGRSMGELAKAVLMNHPALTKTIDRMIMRAFVHRRHDPADNRRVLVFISEFGADLVAQCEGQIATYEDALAARLGPGNAERLRKLLHTLVADAS